MTLESCEDAVREGDHCVRGVCSLVKELQAAWKWGSREVNDLVWDSDPSAGR